MSLRRWRQTCFPDRKGFFSPPFPPRWKDISAAPFGEHTGDPSPVVQISVVALVVVVRQPELACGSHETDASCLLRRRWIVRR